MGRSELYPQIDCRYFSGYRPCSRNSKCDSHCLSYSRVDTRILVISLEALGAVLRSTTLLPAIKQAYPRSHITWVTKPKASELLQNISDIDRLFTTKPEDLLSLRSLQFDVAMVVDKSLEASGILCMTQAKKVFGFAAYPETGAILPQNSGAVELWSLGLSNSKKFYENKKTEVQLLREAMELPLVSTAQFEHEYQVMLTEREKEQSQRRRQEWLQKYKSQHIDRHENKHKSKQNPDYIIGINTGASPTIPYKKLSLQGHQQLLEQLHRAFPDSPLVLLGGEAEAESHRAILDFCPYAQLSPVDQGIRDGLVSIQACDVIISGDSLGMHMAIALKKWVVAWFGPTCAHEIELYGRGVKVLSHAKCGPCWKRTCSQEVMCYDLVHLDELVEGVRRGIHVREVNSIHPNSFCRGSPARNPIDEIPPAQAL